MLLQKQAFRLDLDQTGQSISFTYYPPGAFRHVEVESHMPHGEKQNLGSIGLQSLRVQLAALLAAVRELDRIEHAP
jgi:hypothetical protein